MAELRNTGSLKLDINGTETVLSEEDLLIETLQKEGYVTESDQSISVVLDGNLTPELIEERIRPGADQQDPDHAEGSRL